MCQQIKLLKVELSEHAEVENELAKRSHFCQRVISKYKTQVKVLKEELKEREDSGTNLNYNTFSSKPSILVGK